MPPALEVREGKLIVCERKIRVHFDRPAALLNRVIGEMRNQEKLRQISVDDQRQRIEVLGFLHFGDRVVVPPQ